jgi:hypothetical protein
MFITLPYAFSCLGMGGPGGMDLQAMMAQVIMDA